MPSPTLGGGSLTFAVFSSDLSREETVWREAGGEGV